MTTQRDGLRHSAPITSLRGGPTLAGGNCHYHNTAYHQRCSLKTPGVNMKNTHELSSLSGTGHGGHVLALANNTKDFPIKSNHRSSVRWTTPAVMATSPPPLDTETTSLGTTSSAYNEDVDKNYLSNRAALMS